MTGFRFVFAIHNHQPVGNFPHVFERAFSDCYRPFLEEVEKHPSFKFSIHFSGPLWEHMESRDRECWALIEAMAGRGQAELLGGGFYEPILSIIPEEDRIGQVEMMSRFLEERFGRRPRGLWLTERVWEPFLPKTLAQAGIEYTLLDEEHFNYAGIRDIQTTYITEEEGRPLRLFPIDKKLRYLIPFHPLGDLEAHFRSIQARGGAAIIGDDGEKFGLWPGTKKWVYEEGWLRRFLEFLEEKGIRAMTCSEFLDENPPGGRAYIPPASYEEMLEWVLEPPDLEILKRIKTLVPDEGKRFIRGGSFREFFLKYPEANQLHKRMLLVSREIRDSESRTAREALYKGQCNDPYWHGVFGGLYLPHLRESAYHNLLEAERCLPPSERWEELDFDLDGRTELFFRGRTFHILVKPSYGGSVLELDLRSKARNLTDVLSRRPESYHVARKDVRTEGGSIHELAKKLPEGAEELLRYDWHPRYSCLDHFLHPSTTLPGFLSADYAERGDFTNQEDSWAVRGDSLILTRDGGVWADGERLPLRVSKTIRPEGPALFIRHEIENTAGKPIELLFGSEWSFLVFPNEIEFPAPREAALLGRSLSFRPLDPAGLWHFPLRTLSQSEEGFDIIHQGVCLMPIWNLKLAAGEKSTFDLEIRETHGR